MRTPIGGREGKALVRGKGLSSLFNLNSETLFETLVIEELFA